MSNAVWAIALAFLSATFVIGQRSPPLASDAPSYLDVPPILENAPAGEVGVSFSACQHVGLLPTEYQLVDLNNTLPYYVIAAMTDVVEAALDWTDCVEPEWPILVPQVACIQAVPALGTNVQFAARAYYKCWSEPTPVQAALVTGAVYFPPGDYNGTVVSSSAVVSSVGWERS